MRIKFGFLLFIPLLFSPLSARGQTRLDLSGTIEWDKGELSAAASLNLGSAGIKLPTGRIRGEEILGDEWPALIRPYLLKIQVDSSSTVEDLVNNRETTLAELDNISLEAAKIPPSLSADLAFMTGRYTIPLKSISAALIRHRRAVDQARPFIPSPAADYTGIIIIADTELPIHGRNTSALVRPCIFPRVWDTNMNLVYEKNMTDPAITASGTGALVRYTRAENIFRPTPSGIDESLAALVGTNPIRILARAVFGSSPTDPVIDREDALAIISSENNRRLLREGRVAIVLNESVLKVPLGRQ
ncbi:hypothetical protein [Leadbettera azotonutricia]|uniref:Putative OmpA family protein n=1 Tax=Leadbettera azotonutricia (strain ATCC BAA-888 / DSM 13862 / ZAS-9) TaxID=545695 RepID=F5Y8F1_LEAAZ|nr:hypothetical protein [Leadbettera azotonutricia]AEF83467.1 putative OmpA family protein [Leadbettera azotonutricia ZAS-9]